MSIPTEIHYPSDVFKMIEDIGGASRDLRRHRVEEVSFTKWEPCFVFTAKKTVMGNTIKFCRAFKRARVWEQYVYEQYVNGDRETEYAKDLLEIMKYGK
jgi:hypothetical protein